VRKYLAAKCHFSQQPSSSQKAQSAQASTAGESWREKMHSRMEKERQREWKREATEKVGAWLLSLCDNLSATQIKAIFLYRSIFIRNRSSQ
jgi:hypothetical protein